MLKTYISKFSYFKNEKINLKINSCDNLSSIKMYKFYDLKIVYHHTEFDKKNFVQPDITSKLPFIEGYNWKVNYIIDLNNKLLASRITPGLYFIEINDTNNNSYCLPINIKNDTNNSVKNIILLNSNTWNAYNDSGGSSFYRYNLSFESKYGPLETNKLYPKENTGCTFERPFDKLSDEIKLYIKNNGRIEKLYSHLIYGELRLLKFMELNNIKYDLLDDIDLHSGSIDISKYENFILNCHPEYWTIEMNNNINNNANNIISFAGNVSYRKITIENNIIYKNGLHGKNKLINITGSYYSSLGYDTFAPYKIYKEGHILFNGIKDDYIGTIGLNIYPAKEKIENGTSGCETDKNINRGSNDILAKGENPNNGGGDILLFDVIKNKRTILSVGSIAFTGGLFIDKNTELFIKNVFTFFNMI